jgi:hypothetical protein
MSEKTEKRREPKHGKPPKLRVVGVDETKISDYPPADALYFRELHKIIDEVFLEAFETYQWNWFQLAANSGLAYQTVANLGDRKTKWPQLRTIWRLCKSVGWDLITKEQPKGKRTTVQLAKTG